MKTEYNFVLQTGIGLTSRVKTLSEGRCYSKNYHVLLQLCKSCNEIVRCSQVLLFTLGLNLLPGSTWSHFSALHRKLLISPYPALKTTSDVTLPVTFKTEAENITINSNCNTNGSLTFMQYRTVGCYTGWSFTLACKACCASSSD